MGEPNLHTVAAGRRACTKLSYNIAAIDVRLRLYWEDRVCMYDATTEIYVAIDVRLYFRQRLLCYPHVHESIAKALDNGQGLLVARIQQQLPQGTSSTSCDCRHPGGGAGGVVREGYD